jgi:hypothetical protein
MKSPSDETVFFNGSDLERWMLKCLVGFAASKNATSGVKPECISAVVQ